MLKHLIGYEFKSTRRMFLPGYAVVLLLSIVNAVFTYFQFTSYSDSVGIPFGITFSLFLLAMFAICILTFAYMISRFYKNLLGDEGYLMFTLPVKPSALIWSKCIASSLWMLFTAIVCSLSLGIFLIPVVAAEGVSFAELYPVVWDEISYIAQSLWMEYHVHLILLPILYIVLGIFFTMNFCMHIYACLSIGSMFNKHRLGMSFLAYLGFGVVSEFLVMGGGMLLDALPFDLSFSLNLNTAADMYLSTACLLVVTIIRLLINFVITNYILTRHLNLQ